MSVSDVGVSGASPLNWSIDDDDELVQNSDSFTRDLGVDGHKPAKTPLVDCGVGVRFGQCNKTQLNNP